VSAFKIFWSWQSDHDGKISRFFIRNCFNDAIKNISDELELETHERPELDHDVKDVDGPAVIIDSITNKIDSSDHFIADITPIARTDKGKAVPNPNVMIELGYALATMEVNEITLIANTHYYRGPDDLPFDLKGRTGVKTYELSPTASSTEIKRAKKTQTKRLERILKRAVETSLPAPTSVGGKPVKQYGEGSNFWYKPLKPIEGISPTSGKRVRINPAIGSCSVLRILPTGWPDKITWGMLSPAQDGVALFSQMGNSADYLKSDDGYITYEPKTKLDRIDGDGDLLALTIVMKATGEIWHLNFSAVNLDSHNRKSLYGLRVLRAWNQILKNAETLYGKVGAKGPFKIITGIFSGASIPAALFGESIVGYINSGEPRLVTNSRNLKQSSREQILIDHYNNLCDLAECRRKIDRGTLHHFLGET